MGKLKCLKTNVIKLNIFSSKNEQFCGPEPSQYLFDPFWNARKWMIVEGCGSSGAGSQAVQPSEHDVVHSKAALAAGAVGRAGCCGRA